MKKFIRAATASVLIVTTSAWSMAAIAGPIAPEAYLSSSDSAVMEGQRAQVVDWLQRDEVRTQMTRFGVSTDQAVDRVAALSDEEVQRLAEKIDSTPVGAGGGGVIGAVIFVFLVLLVTDILGLTKIFPFTRSVR
ncbi:PA2779 family protein [Paraperlucidibaca sp.]|uniref:PA2779 family protein n=1 Tax=Paraperlucidibaca sp. TaxID=2708021 RepID=UPI0030F478B2|tara:strand:- start:76 stop:480 length:405 start_codon:yes stop_codon:yes gene_type:complete